MLKRLRQASISQEGPAPPNARQNTNASLKDTKNAPVAATTQQSPTTKPILGQAGRGPSLLGLLAAKRLTRNLRNKYHRSGSVFGSSRYSNSIQLQKEPSYRMEPKRKFKPEEVEKVIQSIVDQRMQGFKYHPKFCPNMCKILTDELKDGVKKLRYDRYKIVAVVHIGERKDQSALVASRCAWDNKLDDYACYSMETPTLFCTASVFGIYCE
ncbi:hypothetical protein ACF0H5_005397 [Mactra antiquata]